MQGQSTPATRFPLFSTTIISLDKTVGITFKPKTALMHIVKGWCSFVGNPILKSNIQCTLSCSFFYLPRGSWLSMNNEEETVHCQRLIMSDPL